VHAVLKWHEHVPSAAQHVRLKSSFSIECDDAGFERAFSTPELLHNCDAIVRDIPKRQEQNPNQENGNNNTKDEHERENEHNKLLSLISGFLCRRNLFRHLSHPRH
jgi:hypothetical protein